MLTPFPPCGYSYEALEKYNKVDSNTLCCTILSDDGIPCGRKLKDHPSQAELTAQRTAQRAAQRTAQLTSEPPGK